MFVTDNTIAAESLGDLFNSIDKKGVCCVKSTAKKVCKNPGRASENGANVDGADAPRNFKEALSSILDVIIFNYSAKGLYLGQFVHFLLFNSRRKSK